MIGLRRPIAPQRGRWVRGAYGSRWESAEERARRDNPLLRVNAPHPSALIAELGPDECPECQRIMAITDEAAYRLYDQHVTAVHRKRGAATSLYGWRRR